MNTSYAILFVILTSACIFTCKGDSSDRFKAGVIYSKDGSTISIERPWFSPKDIIIHEDYALPRAKTWACFYGGMVSLGLGGLAGYYSVFHKNINWYERLFSALSTVGLGYASKWLFLKSFTLSDEEIKAIESARKAAQKLEDEVWHARGSFNKITLKRRLGILLGNVFRDAEIKELHNKHYEWVKNTKSNNSI